MKLKPVEVKWIDAHSSMDAMVISDLEKCEPIETKSCGYLIKEDKEKVVLAFMCFGTNVLEEELLKHYQVIPRKMIVSIKELFEPHGVLIRANGKEIPLTYIMTRQEDGMLFYNIINKKSKEKLLKGEISKVRKPSSKQGQAKGGGK